MNNIQNKRRMPRSDRRGAAVAEFALVVPLLALLAMGAIDVAQSINVAQAINDASREGARQASLYEVTTVAEVENYVRQYVADAFPNVAAGSIASAVTVEVRDRYGNPPPSGDLTAIESGASVSVHVALQFGVVQLTNFIPGFDQIIVRTTTVMRRE